MTVMSRGRAILPGLAALLLCGAANAAEYELSDSQDALLTMTVAACSMDEGPKARNAFRKLKGRELRSQAMVACREADVNVTSNVSGYTGGELMAQARYAFDKGKYEAAYDKAHASNKVERSSDALLLKGRAACKLGRDAEAKRLIPHISKKARATLIESCKADGVEL